MESTPSRVVLAIIGALVGPDWPAFGIGMAVLSHGQAWIPPRKGCG